MKNVPKLATYIFLLERRIFFRNEPRGAGLIFITILVNKPISIRRKWEQNEQCYEKVQILVFDKEIAVEMVIA